MERNKHHVDALFIIILIGLFAIFSVAIALLGVNVYKTTATSSQDQLNTAAHYFAQQVRQCEDKTQVRVANLQGEIPSLVISSIHEGNSVETWFFVSDGSLKEVTVASDSEVNPEFGQDVMKLKSADFKLVKKNLLRVTLTSADDTTNTINLSLIGGGGN